ncbi:MAG TPA: FtsW/RodA/SpoVE family cell cycle protein, partial [Bryobacteraceae bacterium]
MAVTRSKAVERAEVRRSPRQRSGWRLAELTWTTGAVILVSFGLYLVYQAKSPALAEVEQGLAAKKLLNLNGLAAREDLLPALNTLFPDAAERELAARKIYYLSGGLSNVGGVARIRVTAEDLGSGRGLKTFRDRLGTRQSEALLTGEQLREWKPMVVVRRPGQFQRSFFLWAGLFLVAFLLVHAWWSLRGFTGDQALLPAVLLLTGVGFILMVSLRDPVRDNLLFVDFAQGLVGGCILLAALSTVNYERLFGKLSYVPLLASFVLSAMLILFGRGPGTSDAKVNLFGFQPVEIIRLLLVFFLAGYFGSRWDVLRHARETRARLAALTSRFDIPPVEYTLPALVSVLFSLLFFFLQRDMGPALVFACLFLVLYGMARGSLAVPVAGLTLLALGFAFGYYLGVPHTVGERVSMWLSP